MKSPMKFLNCKGNTFQKCILILKNVITWMTLKLRSIQKCKNAINSDKTKLLCESTINIEEVKQALSTMSNNKSL